MLPLQATLQAEQLALALVPLGRLVERQGPEPAPDWWLLVSRQLTAPGVQAQALQQQSSELQARAPAPRPAGAAGREQVQGPAAWRQVWLPPPAGEVLRRAPPLARRELVQVQVLRALGSGPVEWRQQHQQQLVVDPADHLNT